MIMCEDYYGRLNDNSSHSYHSLIVSRVYFLSLDFRISHVDRYDNDTTLSLVIKKPHISLSCFCYHHEKILSHATH